MDDPVLIVAVVWLTGLLAAAVGLIARRQPDASRILSLEVLVFVLISVLVVVGGLEGVDYYQDAALALALLSFVSTFAAVRFLDRGDPR